MTAWRIGQFLTREDLHDGGRLSVVHDGPYVQTLRWTRELRQSTLTLDITLRAGMPRLDYCLRVDWREMGSREAGTPPKNPKAATCPSQNASVVSAGYVLMNSASECGSDIAK